MGETTLLTKDARESNKNLLLLYSSASVAGPIFERLAASTHAVMLCPVTTAVERWGSQLDPDLVIIVVDGEGDELIERCEAIRELTDRPIVVVSDCCEERTVVTALNAGVDEFVSTTVGDEELFARIDSLLRRYRGPAQDRWPGPAQDRWQAGGLTLCASELSAEAAGRRVLLTPIEFRLLSCLASAPGKVFTHQTLMSRVWGAEYVDARHYLYLYIGYLREKLELDAKQPRIIMSEWGVGYRLAG